MSKDPLDDTRFKAYLVDKQGDQSSHAVGELRLGDLAPGGVLVAVEWSSVNYKDGLAVSPNGRVARIFPLVPGIDLAGTVVESDSDVAKPGDAVIAHGYDIGVSHHGGYAEYARVPSDWIVPLPSGLSAREAMILGTAGFTAALSVLALQERGMSPSAGRILVTGATGGVGSMAVAILSKLGYEVVASTAKQDAHGFLKSLGASQILPRDQFSTPSSKPLESMAWAGAVDCVGGVTLANVLKQLQYGAAVAASGLTGGTDLPTTVMPFILRGVACLGIDSVQTPIRRRREVWDLLGGVLKPDNLEGLAQDVTLDSVAEALSAIMAGQARGRFVVKIP
jgi:putative YhdH/YhfP family quinone oxidoreductase